MLQLQADKRALAAASIHRRARRQPRWAGDLECCLPRYAIEAELQAQVDAHSWSKERLRRLICSSTRAA